MTTPQDQNKAVVQRFFDAWNARQADAFDALATRDVTRHCEATPDVLVRNIAELKSFLQQDTAVFPDSVQTVRHIVADGDMVAVWATYQGTQRGPIGKLPASNRQAQFDFACFFRMQSGRIAEWWVTWDNLTILRGLGHMPGG